jgi:murein DD-endopeptidase MepM/ murein hydrolase activator NlpD
MVAFLAALLLSTCATAPVDAPVIDPYRPPACRWCPGNRGIDYGTLAGTPVRSVVAGVVTFAGPVATVGYVVVALPDGRRLTYGGLIGIAVAVGDRVATGHILGTSGTSLHFGVRRGNGYEDPDVVLRGRSRARLVRVDGLRRPSSAPSRCAAQVVVG